MRGKTIHFIAQVVNYALLARLADYLVPAKGIKWAGVFVLLCIPPTVVQMFSKVRS